MPEVTLLSIDHIAKRAMPKIANTDENIKANSLSPAQKQRLQ